MSSFAHNQPTILEDNDEMEAIECCADDLRTTMEPGISMEDNETSHCGKPILAGEQQVHISLLACGIFNNRRMLS